VTVAVIRLFMGLHEVGFSADCWGSSVRDRERSGMLIRVERMSLTAFINRFVAGIGMHSIVAKLIPLRILTVVGQGSAALIGFPRMCSLIIANPMIFHGFKSFLSCTSSPEMCHPPEEVIHARAFGKAPMNWMRNVIPSVPVVLNFGTFHSSDEKCSSALAQATCHSLLPPDRFPFLVCHDFIGAIPNGKPSKRMQCLRSSPDRDRHWDM
jgi:hypothetical protein